MYTLQLFKSSTHVKKKNKTKNQKAGRSLRFLGRVYSFNPIPSTPMDLSCPCPSTGIPYPLVSCNW